MMLPAWSKLFLFLLLLIPVNNYGQRELHTSSKKAESLFREASNHIARMNYNAAIPLLEKAIKSDEAFLEAYLRLSEAYLKSNRREEGYYTYRKGLDFDPTFYPRGYLNLAILQFYEGNYQDALENIGLFNTHKKDSDDDEQADRYEASIRFSINAMNNPVDFSPTSLGTEINSPYSEYWPSLSADELTMVFTRAVPIDTANHQAYKNRQEDFYISHKRADGWSLAKSMGRPLNTIYNEGAQTISADGRTMVYTVCNRNGIVGRCDLYISSWNGDTWTPPQNMGRNINTPAKETQPSLSFNGRILYFASDRSDSKGKLDIYKSTLNDDGQWSLPVNLGDSINTPGDEMSPFIHHDNKTLYFSSDYHTGMGKTDLFMSEWTGTHWTHAKNLGYPLNTHEEEIGLIVNASGSKAYYATGRGEGHGNDIYTFDMPKEIQPSPATYMKGLVYDSLTQKPLTAAFEIISIETQETVNKSESDKSGNFLLVMPTNNSYLINVSKPGYLFYSRNIALAGVHEQTNPYFVDIPLQPIQEGVHIVLENIFYETDKYTLLDGSKAELSKMYEFLVLNKNVTIEISGHTDNVGDPDYNQQLSENRAKEVANYLINQGIDQQRVTFIGYGMEKPIADNSSAEGRAKNRRTVLKITKVQ